MNARALTRYLIERRAVGVQQYRIDAGEYFQYSAIGPITDGGIEIHHIRYTGDYYTIEINHTAEENETAPATLYRHDRNGNTVYIGAGRVAYAPTGHVDHAEFCAGATSGSSTTNPEIAAIRLIRGLIDAGAA